MADKVLYTKNYKMYAYIAYALGHKIRYEKKYSQK